LSSNGVVDVCCAEYRTAADAAAGGVFTGDALLTSNHLLAAMLAPHSSSSSVTHSLLQQLGLDAGQVSAAVAAGLGGTAAGSTGAAAEDVLACEPLGFLHEEFYASLCAELRQPGAAPSSSMMPCMN
jgi:hypothetical protein